MGKKISLFYRVKEKYQGKNPHDSEFGDLKGYVGIYEPSLLVSFWEQNWARGSSTLHLKGPQVFTAR